MPIDPKILYVNDKMKSKLGTVSKPFAVYYKTADNMGCIFVDTTANVTELDLRAEVKKAFPKATNDKIFYGEIVKTGSNFDVTFGEGTAPEILKLRGKKSTKNLAKCIGVDQNKIGAITITGLDETTAEIPAEDEVTTDTTSSSPSPDKITLASQAIAVGKIFGKTMTDLENALKAPPDGTESIIETVNAGLAKKGDFLAKFTELASVLKSGGDDDSLATAINNLKAVINDGAVTAAITAVATDGHTVVSVREELFGNLDETLELLLATTT